MEIDTYLYEKTCLIFRCIFVKNSTTLQHLPVSVLDSWSTLEGSEIIKKFKKLFIIFTVIFCGGILVTLGNGCSKVETDSPATPTEPVPEPVDPTPPEPGPQSSFEFPPDTVDETACISLGWNKVNIAIGTVARKVLWKAADSGVTSRGSIIVLHGGGGKASHFCSVSDPEDLLYVKAQLNFAKLATQQGFNLFILDSTDDIVTDDAGDNCGKRFDFPIQNRPNLDIPYIEHVITNLIPTARPAGSDVSIFMTGQSTGGYMTIRASTHFDKYIKAFTPIAAGDPYGTYADCDPANDHGATGTLHDNETKKQITNDNACLSTPPYINESPWESSTPGQKPKFKQFHSRYDGIVDLTCMQKVGELLRQNGYLDSGAFVAQDGNTKTLGLHYWRDLYNQPILDFFKSIDASESDRINAATLTANTNLACTVIQPFYWEIGSATGKIAGATSGGSNPSSTSVLPIASASKLMFAAYVIEKRSGNLTAAEVDGLNLKAGFSEWTSSCAGYTTVGLCFDGAVGFVSANVGKFFYSGGHIQKMASEDMGLRSMGVGALATEMNAYLGSDVGISFSLPQPSGGIRLSADKYGLFLRKILNKSLRMHSFLGSNSTCTNPANCSSAVSTAIPSSESWSYSLGHWIESDPEVGDTAYSSPGLYGFYPWISADKNLYGILARSNGGASAYWDSVKCGRLIRKAYFSGAIQ